MSIANTQASCNPEGIWTRIRKERTVFDLKLPLYMGAAKVLAQAVLPRGLRDRTRGLYYAYLKHRIHRPELVAPIAKQVRYTVQAGPFAGMVYPPEIVATDAHFLAKVLGCYEMECHSLVGQICARSYDEIINIGAAEGYYAVGLALRIPSATVYAFETESKSRALCMQLAHLNGAGERVRMGGFCDPPSLAAILENAQNRTKRKLLVCDCEGGEVELLDPIAIPALRSADLLIELHDVLRPGIRRIMTTRFTPTHSLEFVTSVPRDPDAYPALSTLGAEDRAFLLSEHRKGPMEWVLCTAMNRTAPTASGRALEGAGAQ
jgi:hypothetical protein